MKKGILLGWLALMMGWAVCAEGKIDEAASATTDGDTSYAFGMMIGSELKTLGITFNYNTFMKGMREVLEDKNTTLTMDEAVAKVQSAYMEAMAKQDEVAIAKEQSFLAENAKKPGVQITESGLQYEIITEGTGEKPGPTATVSAHYRGAFVDGTVFDSSYDRGEPMEFPLYAVIPGWSEGVQLMSVGSKYRLYIPSELAYGAQGGGNVIPAYATLIFDVELLAIIQNEEDTDSESEEWY
ncbi:MAG: FKBP-type peptidyl-prolyl cis-trans isomerase [Spirochaetaceae bacterium]|jgi:FKBP-type peptidyl-prolyl cis-trans isomerase FkpA|nr:FKBP-type peptidyl-prolyl cis-trans isomerase [Spirochaetaceae bacterium]